MATRIEAITAYRPRIKLGKRVEMDELVAFIARSTGLNEGTIRQVLIELRDAALFYLLQGHSVGMEGLGTYTPTIALNGTFGVGHRADMKLKNGMNAPGAFSGPIINRGNIGKTGDELVAMWNEEHPNNLATP